MAPQLFVMLLVFMACLLSLSTVPGTRFCDSQLLIREILLLEVDQVWFEASLLGGAWNHDVGEARFTRRFGHDSGRDVRADVVCDYLKPGSFDVFELESALGVPVSP